MSYAKIAAALGVSESLVAKELKRPGNVSDPDAAAAGDAGAGDVLPFPTSADPALQTANAQLQAERIEVARLELQLKRTDLQKRMQLYDGAGQQGSQGALLLQFIDSQLTALRAEITRLASQRTQPLTAPPPSETEILERAVRQQELLKTLAPPRPPTTAADLELQVALDRLNLEREERMRRLDEELEERRAQRENDRIRSEAIAEQIKSWGPILQGAVTRWVEQQGQTGNGAAAAPRPLIPQQTDPSAEVITAEGLCPGCQAPLRLRGYDKERCPKCQMEIRASNGKILPVQPPPSRAVRVAS